MSALLLLLLAVPGPDSTAVVANANDPESVALAEIYRAARSIPKNQVCALDLPSATDIELADYLAKLEAPLDACLGAARERIEAIVVMRGVPLRVSVPYQGGADLVSLTAALSIAKSTLTGTTARVLGMRPGFDANCGGTPCVAASWSNPFRSGTFHAGFSERFRGVDWQLLIATMIHGRSFDDARKLIASATTAEALGGATGTFLLMNGADPARGVLDLQYDGVQADLEMLGFTVERAPFDPNLTGRTLAALLVGTAGIGTTIEGNAYLPGSLVDNLTSFGAHPNNFGDPSAEVQVSIARWVAKGVAGVHGTVDEPLNNVFPNRRLIVDYAEGGTLGEAYFRNLPFVYWKNLVLGDPMCAPYAERPRVSIDVQGDQVVVTATHSAGIDSIVVLADGEPIDGTLPERDRVELLAVAQAGGTHAPKGWATLSWVRPPPDAGMTIEMDSGTLDAGTSEDATTADAGSQPAEDEGCACNDVARGGAPAPQWWLGGLLIFGLTRLCRARGRLRTRILFMLCSMSGR